MSNEMKEIDWSTLLITYINIDSGRDAQQSQCLDSLVPKLSLEIFAHYIIHGVE